MRSINEIQADITRHHEAQLPVVRTKRNAQQVDAWVKRNGELCRELKAAMRPTPRPPRHTWGVTREQALAADQVAIGGAWKDIMRVSQKSLTVLWAGVERENVRLDRLTADDLRIKP